MRQRFEIDVRRVLRVCVCVNLECHSRGANGQGKNVLLSQKRAIKVAKIVRATWPRQTCAPPLLSVHLRRTFHHSLFAPLLRCQSEMTESNAGATGMRTSIALHSLMKNVPPLSFCTSAATAPKHHVVCASSVEGSNECV